MNPDPDTEIPEAVLANRLNIPRATFTEWRKQSKLKFPKHFKTRGRGEIIITTAGMAKVEALLQLDRASLTHPDEGEKPTPKIKVCCIAPTANPRRITARLLNGQRCVVILITPRVFARQFKKGSFIEVQPSATAGVFEFHGKAPKRFRL